MDKTTAYGWKQNRRRMIKDDRGIDDDFDSRLADGFDLMAEDDPVDPLPKEIASYSEED